MNSTASKVIDLSPIDWVVDMTGALASVAADAGGIGVRPCYLQVSYAALADITDERPWHVSVQVDDVTAADTLADYYGLPADDEETTNYHRHGVAELIDQSVALTVYTRRPKDRIALIREWVAVNYSDESKRLVTEGAEATREDQAKFAAADAAGLFEVSR